MSRSFAKFPVVKLSQLVSIKAPVFVALQWGKFQILWNPCKILSVFWFTATVPLFFSVLLSQSHVFFVLGTSFSVRFECLFRHTFAAFPTVPKRRPIFRTLFSETFQLLLLISLPALFPIFLLSHHTNEKWPKHVVSARLCLFSLHGAMHWKFERVGGAERHRRIIYRIDKPRVRIFRVTCMPNCLWGQWSRDCQGTGDMDYQHVHFSVSSSTLFCQLLESFRFSHSSISIRNSKSCLKAAGLARTFQFLPDSLWSRVLVVSKAFGTRRPVSLTSCSLLFEILK